MKRTILAVLLVLISITALADDLVSVGSVTQSGQTYELFVIPSSIQQTSKNHVKMWTELYEDSSIKFKTRYEYNCSELESKQLYLIVHAPDGHIIMQGDPHNNWIPVSPHSLDYATIKYACANRK